MCIRRTRTCIAPLVIPQSFPLLLLKKMDLGEKILQNPKRREWKKWNNGERERDENQVA
jgi:hypothetical protein